VAITFKTQIKNRMIKNNLGNWNKTILLIKKIVVLVNNAKLLTYGSNSLLVNIYIHNMKRRYRLCCYFIVFRQNQRAMCTKQHTWHVTAVELPYAILRMVVVSAAHARDIAIVRALVE